MSLHEPHLCEVCDDRIEDPRVALGFTTCAACASRSNAHADPDSPPWNVAGADE